MTAKKYLPIALFIGLQAALLQALDQSICAFVVPLVAGGGWISFQSWAVYFLAGCTPKGGLRALIGYVLGMIASIAIMMGGGTLGSLGFWAMPAILMILVPVILYLDIAPELFSLVPAVFVGAGVFFGIMSYVPGAAFGSAFVSETIYCLIGLVFGWLTITFRGWYERNYVHTPAAK
ncbi:MAG: DUF1097 domain-containing protein [Lawsonibacter sp.]|nr:DUF1097 domain-containing protein [Lawsonibacter sp.]